jgi:hypothetical protein
MAVLFVALVFGQTGGVVKAADEFLTSLGSGRIAEAYQSTSPDLRAQQSPEVFEKTVKDLGLTDFASASWSSRGFTKDQGHGEGFVTTKSHGSISLRIVLRFVAMPMPTRIHGLCVRRAVLQSRQSIRAALPSFLPHENKALPPGTSHPRRNRQRRPASPADRLNRTDRGPI